MRHTPGPWGITGESWRDYEGAEIGTVNKTVAIINTPEIGPDEEDAANAKLIATAPELLEALEMLLKETHDSIGKFKPNLYKHCKEVLAKAGR